jgi:ribA/ribD-fused uncharacterized protein
MITSFRGTFLSNFWPSPVIWGGLSYPTVEHAYVAAKHIPETLWGPDDLEYEIFCNLIPGIVKKYGKKITARKDWDRIKIAIMENLLRQKFAFGTPLAEKLMETGDQELIEGNTWDDIFWGVCNGVGENNLGRILMEIREELFSYD